MDSTATKTYKSYKKKDITVFFIPNLFSDDGRVRKSFEYKRSWTIHKYLKKSGFDVNDMMIAVNGHKTEDLTRHLIIGDEISIYPTVGYIPGAETFAAMVWWTQAAIIAYNVAVVSLMAYSIYSAVTTKKESYDTLGEGLDEGSTYAWDGVRTTSNAGTPIPIIYGERAYGGKVINEYVSNDGEKDYLHTLLGVGWGELESITMRRINQNVADNYTGWSLTTRMGTLNQEVIPNFNDSHNLISIGVKLLKDSAYTYTTTDDDVEAFEVHFNFPAGLYQQDSSGNISSWSVTYKVEYKLHSQGEWIQLGSTTVSDKTRNDFKRVYRKDGLVAGQYDIRVTKTSDDPSDLEYPVTNGNFYIERIDEISCEDEQIFPRIALAGVDNIALEQLSGSFPDYELLVKGRKITIPKVMNGEETVDWDDYYWDPDDEVYRLFSDDTELSWDGETFITAYSANPIWCTYDLMTNTIFGAGHYITSDDNDIDFLVSQSQYCEEKVPDGNGGYEKRFRLDIVIDSQQKAFDLIVQLCTIFRAYPFYSDRGKVKIVIEKPETSVQLFSPGNIVEGSFSQTWASKSDVPNMVSVQFDDEDNNYESQTVLAVVDDEALANNDPLNTKTMRYYGVKESYAKRYGRDYFKSAKYITETINFDSALCSILRQCGEVIDIAHDVPQWGFGGSIQQGISTTQVILDRSVTIEESKSYALRIDFASGGYEERTVSNSAGTYNELTVSTAFSQVPAKGDIYVFGEVDKIVKKARITKVERNRNGTVSFTASEYDADIYDDSAVSISTKKTSSLSTDFPNVTNLTLSETVVVKDDGTISDAIEIDFNKPNMADYIASTFSRAKIYYSDNAGASWICAGETSGTTFIISDNIIVGNTYKICVVSVSVTGEERGKASSPQASITIEGYITYPADVENFAYSWGDVLSLVWKANTETDLAGYEIRNEDDNWGVGELLETYLSTEDGNILITEDGNNLAFEPTTENLIYRGLAIKKVLYPTERDVGTYYIKAFNTSGRYSENAVSITPELYVPTTPEGLDVDVMFNTARIYWTDNRPTNLLYYEVYRSETNLWEGEEELIGRVSGKALTINSKSPRSGMAQSGSATSLIDSNLIGLGDGYFTGDTLVITKGTGEGLTATITGFNDTTGELTFDDIGATIDDTSQYNITDNIWIKVRGVDQYGSGAFSSALEINFENLSEDMFGDNVITARKIYVACLSALSANLGYINAGTIQGATIQTASSGARTVFSGTELRSYDSYDNVMFEVCDGCVTARTMKLVDPNCECCYSYLSAGQWYFHDELGNSNPYVKRLCAGEVNTGSTVCLPGWKGQPYIQLGIKDLAAYDPNFSVNCQKWCVYHCNLCCYCNSSTDYGWSFDAHASLYKSAGEYAENCVDVAFDTSVYTHSDAYWTRVRNRFLLWCFDCSCSICYGYGVLCYRIKYKCCEAGCAWTCCDYLYTQPHDSTVSLKTCYDECRNICFPSAGCWEIQSTCLSLTWCLSNLSGMSTNCCCRAINACCAGITCTVSNSVGSWESHSWYNCHCVPISGSSPSNVYCAYVCLCVCSCFETWFCNYCWYVDGGGLHYCSYAWMWGSHCFFVKCCGWPNSGSYCLKLGDCLVADCYWSPSRTEGEGLGVLLPKPPQVECCYWLSCCCYNLNHAYDYTHICACNYVFYCVAYAGVCCYISTYNSVINSYLIQCYYSYASDTTCEYKRLYSIKDYSETQTILDPNGILNYLAIGYS